MNSAAHDLPERYSEALTRYLAGADEVVLNQAYELGRKALGDGLGVLDIAMLHHGALDAAIASEPACARSAEIAKAAEFLAETLSPFEMSLSGYRETNARLTAMNETLRQAKAAAEAANRELEAFSYSVAHDLRAPLRGLDGFSQALLEDYADKLGDEGRGYLGHLRDSAQMMGRLIDDLLALSRVTRADMVREAVDLSDLARSVATQLQRARPGRRIELVIAAGVVAEGDARLLRIALENLLGNAWKFTGKRAEPRIEVGVTSGEMKAAPISSATMAPDSTWPMRQNCSAPFSGCIRSTNSRARASGLRPSSASSTGMAAGSGRSERSIMARRSTSRSARGRPRHEGRDHPAGRGQSE